MEFLCCLVYLGSEETWLRKEKVGGSEPGVGEGLGNFISLRASCCCLYEVSYKVFSAIWASAPPPFFFFMRGLSGLQFTAAFPLLDGRVCVRLGEWNGR